MSRILVGRISDAHGIRGAVKIRSFTEDPAQLAGYSPLLLASGQTVDILRMKPAKDEFIADLKGVTDRNAAEALKGQDLFVSRDRLPAPTDGQFYLHDLEGLPVSCAGTVLGVVAGFQNFGAGDLMELDNGLLVPVSFVQEVGAAIEVDLPTGFLDADDTPRGQGGRA